MFQHKCPYTLNYQNFPKREDVVTRNVEFRNAWFKRHQTGISRNRLNFLRNTCFCQGKNCSLCSTKPNPQILKRRQWKRASANEEYDIYGFHVTTGHNIIQYTDESDDDHECRVVEICENA